MEQKILKSVSSFIEDYQLKNNIKNIWRQPIIKYADANSPEIEKFKETISKEHYLSTDFLQNPTVILSYFMPFSEEVSKSNDGSKEMSFLWGYANIETNRLVGELNKYIVKIINKEGHQAAIPTNIGMISSTEIKSRWSQKHIAWLAGFGSFGLNNMIITEEGSCGRLYSIVTNLPITPGKPVTEERCTYKKSGKCMICVKKCPYGALAPEGFKREVCYAVCLENEKNTGANACGKCMSQLPCSFKSYKKP